MEYLPSFLVSLAATAIPLLIFALYMRASMGELIQNVLNDVGEQFTEIFEKPNVKRAFSVLGKKSGESRASDAVRRKAANAIVDRIPSIRMVLEELDIDAIEGLELINDPLIGPVLQGFLKMGAEGIAGLLPQGLNIPGLPNSSGSSGTASEVF